MEKQNGSNETEGKIIEQVSSFNYLGYLISNDKDVSIKLQRCNDQGITTACVLTMERDRGIKDYLW